MRRWYLGRNLKDEREPVTPGHNMFQGHEAKNKFSMFRKLKGWCDLASDQEGWVTLNEVGEM